jgi:hypothetical protein
MCRACYHIRDIRRLIALVRGPRSADSDDQAPVLFAETVDPVQCSRSDTCLYVMPNLPDLTRNTLHQPYCCEDGNVAFPSQEDLVALHERIRVNGLRMMHAFAPFFAALLFFSSSNFLLHIYLLVLGKNITSDVEFLLWTLVRTCLWLVLGLLAAMAAGAVTQSYRCPCACNVNLVLNILCGSRVQGSSCGR